MPGRVAMVCFTGRVPIFRAHVLSLIDTVRLFLTKTQKTTETALTKATGGPGKGTLLKSTCLHCVCQVHMLTAELAKRYCFLTVFGFQSEIEEIPALVFLISRKKQNHGQKIYWYPYKSRL